MSDDVLIIVGDAAETVDTLYPYLRVQEEAFRPVVAGPEARRYQMVLHEIPARAGCVQGRRMATVPKCRFDLEACGGTFVDAPCVVDGNLVSGRTWHDHGQYMKHWLGLLEAERRRQG